MLRPIKDELLVPYDQSPWEQLAGEPDRAYAGFLIYLQLDRRKRTLKEAYRIFSERPDAQTPSSKFYEWSREWHWAERVRAWQKHIDAQDLARLEAEILEWRTNRRALLHGTFGKIAEILDRMDPKDQKASAAQIVQMVQTIADQLRKEYETDELTSADSTLPTIVFANVSMDQYTQRAQPETVEAEAKEK